MMANKLIRRILVGMWALPILLIIFSLCCPTEAVIYEVSPPKVSFGFIGDTYELPIHISSIVGLDAWYVSIDFDPAVLSPTLDPNDAPNIISTSFTDYYHLAISEYPQESDPPDPDKKRLTVAGIFKYDDPGAGTPTGPGALFKIEFYVMDSNVPAASDIEVLVEPDPNAGAGAPELLAGPKGVFYAETVHYELGFNKSLYRVNRDNKFIIPISINSVKDLQAWEMTLTYNSSLMEFNQLLTTALTHGYEYLTYHEITPGVVRIAGMVQDRPSGGSGNFLNLRFKAKKTGTSRIFISYPNDKGNQLGSTKTSISTRVNISQPGSLIGPPVTVPLGIFGGFQFPSFFQYPVFYPTAPYFGTQFSTITPYTLGYMPWHFQTFYYPAAIPSFGFGGSNYGWWFFQ
ncbi:MAG: cohesin domain-containing protein, partial [bacterium]